MKYVAGTAPGSAPNRLVVGAAFPGLSLPPQALLKRSERKVVLIIANRLSRGGFFFLSVR